MLDYATRDLALAIAHHLLIFALAAALAVEIGIVHSGVTGKNILRVAKTDTWFGVFAAAILLVGFSRAIFAAKGWAYYSINAFFWAKIGTFAAVGLLSIGPTVSFIRWRQALKNDPAFVPSTQSIRGVTRFLWAEATLFAFIPAFAAAMARGYGMLAR
jgi:putative membrane protein